MRVGERSHRRDRGAVIPAAALVLTLVMTMAAFTIDLGRMRTERRDLQADADAIALDAVQAIGGLNAVDALPVAIAEANDSADRNGLDVTLTAGEVQVGEWDVDGQLFTPLSGVGDFPTAVQVQLTGSVPMHFDFSADDRSVSREAVAVAHALTRGELGSVFAGIQTYDPTASCDESLDSQMTFMNHLYSEYLGIAAAGGVGAPADPEATSCDVTGPGDGLKLDALSWQGLASGQVDMGDVAGRMGFASTDELLSSNVAAKDLLETSAASMQESGNATDVAAGGVLGSFATHVSSDAELDMADIFGVNAGSTSAGSADAWVNALDLVGMTAMAIDGNHFAAVELPVSVGNVDPVITPKISIIEPPQRDLTLSRPGEAGPHTAQVKIGFDIPLDDVLVDFGILGGTLSSLGLETSDGNFSVVVEVARADSTYGDISCPREGEPTSAFEVETGAFTMSLGTVTDAMLRREEPFNVKPKAMLTDSFSRFSLLGGLLGSIDLGDVTNVEHTETFALGGSQTGGFGGDINVFGATESHTFTGPFDPRNPQPFHRYDGGISGTSITDATYSNADLNTSASLLNLLGVADAAVHNLVNAAMAPVQQELAAEVIDPLLSALGITVAGADGRILEVDCQVPALANRG